MSPPPRSSSPLGPPVWPRDCPLPPHAAAAHRSFYSGTVGPVTSSQHLSSFMVHSQYHPSLPAIGSARPGRLVSHAGCGPSASTLPPLPPHPTPPLPRYAPGASPFDVMPEVAEDAFRDFHHWLSGFLIFSSCYLETRPEEHTNVVKYIFMINELFLGNKDTHWWDNNEKFHKNSRVTPLAGRASELLVGRTVWWLGVRGLHCSAFLKLVLEQGQSWGWPEWLVVHIRGNDLGQL